MAFSLGGDSKAGAGGGFNFGAPAPAPTGTPAPASTGFTFGAPPPAAAPTTSDTKPPVFSLGGNATATPAPAAGAFSFGAPAAGAPALQPAAPGGFSFGATAATESKPATAAATPAPGVGTADAKPAGFSLGGAAPAAPIFGAPAAAEKKDAAPAPAGGFSFAAPATTATAPAAPTPAGGGFSFGGATTAGQPAAAAPPTPAAGSAPAFGAPAAGAPAFGAPATGAPAFGAPAAATTPAAGAPAFGAPAAAATPTAGAPAFGAPAPATTAPPTPATPAPVQTPAKTPAAAPGTTPAPQEELQYKELTVEQILNLFQRNLEIDSKTYLEEARVVLERDGILRDAQTDVANITQKLRSFYVVQSDMEDSLKAINGYQDEMERTLAQAEETIADMFDAQSHMQAGDADLQREVAYATAEEIERRLQAVSSTLEATSRGLEDSIDAKLSGDIRNVVKVLNQHMTSLESLDLAFGEMDKDITEVNQVLRS